MRGGAQTDYSDECLCPLMKIWRMAHRSNLAWKSVGDTVPELNVVFQQLTGLSSFFHKSGLRTRELKSIAAENNLKLLNLPKTFEVRWTEFTTKLVTAVLTCWHALVFYFQKCDDKASKRYLNFLTSLDNLKLLTVLADTLTVFPRYQKRLQSDSTTIPDS